LKRVAKQPVNDDEGPDTAPDPTLPKPPRFERLEQARRAARAIDRESGLVEAVRRFRHRLPGDEKFGDPLSTAEETPVAFLARGVTVMRPDEESVIGELGLAGLQLWQSLSEKAGRGRGEQDIALLYTDIVDFSSWALTAGDQSAVSLLQAVGSAIDRVVADHRGRIIKKLGDGVIGTFLAAQEAVDSALAIQDALAGIELGGYQPQIRAGVHWGRPRRLGGEYLGLDMTILAAVGDAAGGGQVLVSGPALSQLDPAVHGLQIGRRKRLRGGETPRELQVATVRRNPAA
jgi:class 3 adenylate cyclase